MKIIQFYIKFKENAVTNATLKYNKKTNVVTNQLCNKQDYY